MNKLRCLTIAGQAQNGKDFTANIIKELLLVDGQKPLIMHYADYLKYICKSVYGWDGNKDEHGRSILQYVGTDKARKNNPDIWVNVINETLLAIGEDYDICIIPDCRFPNESDKMREFGWDVGALKINRLNFENSLTEEQRSHPSERALDDYEFDFYLDFETGKDSVIHAIAENQTLMEFIYGRSNK